jgi:hypothetical protein
VADERVTERIAREAGLPGLAEALSEKLSPADLQSLLLHVVAQRAPRRRPADLLHQADRQAGLRPSSADARLMCEVDRVAFEAAEGFTALELAPALPLGTSAVLGNIHPNNVLATVRGSEALADPTSALALEAARRRRDGSAAVRLCASERVTRLQPTTLPGFTPHFRILGLVTAGRAQGEDHFETDALAEQISVHLRLLRGLGALGFTSAPVRITLSDTEATAALLKARGVGLDVVRQRVRAHEPGSADAVLAEQGLSLPRSVEDPLAALGGEEVPDAARLRLARARERVVPALAREFPEAAVSFDLGRLHGLGYYTSLCFHVVATDAQGIPMPVADGGFTDWTQRLLASAKERLLTSGLGLELLVKRFR